MGLFFLDQPFEEREEAGEEKGRANGAPSEEVERFGKGGVSEEGLCKVGLVEAHSGEGVGKGGGNAADHQPGSHH